MLKEFKGFAMRGNVLDLAIAVIIGAAFGTIITSLVNDILMPPIGLLLGRMDFKDLYIAHSGSTYASLAAAKAAGAPVVAYGQFLNTVVSFLIVAFAIFVLVKQVNRFQKPVAAPPAAATKECPYCFSVIPAQAVRCYHCTSELRIAASAASA